MNKLEELRAKRKERAKYKIKHTLEELIAKRREMTNIMLAIADKAEEIPDYEKIPAPLFKHCVIQMLDTFDMLLELDDDIIEVEKDRIRNKK